MPTPPRRGKVAEFISKFEQTSARPGQSYGGVPRTAGSPSNSPGDVVHRLKSAAAAAEAALEKVKEEIAKSREQIEMEPVLRPPRKNTRWSVSDELGADETSIDCNEPVVTDDADELKYTLPPTPIQRPLQVNSPLSHPPMSESAFATVLTYLDIPTIQAPPSPDITCTRPPILTEKVSFAYEPAFWDSDFVERPPPPYALDCDDELIYAAPSEPLDMAAESPCRDDSPHQRPHNLAPSTSPVNTNEYLPPKVDVQRTSSDPPEIDSHIELDAKETEPLPHSSHDDLENASNHATMPLHASVNVPCDVDLVPCDVDLVTCDVDLVTPETDGSPKARQTDETVAAQNIRQTEEKDAAEFVQIDLELAVEPVDQEAEKSEYEALEYAYPVIGLENEMSEELISVDGARRLSVARMEESPIESPELSEANENLESNIPAGEFLEEAQGLEPVGLISNVSCTAEEELAAEVNAEQDETPNDIDDPHDGVYDVDVGGLEMLDVSFEPGVIQMDEHVIDDADSGSESSEASLTEIPPMEQITSSDDERVVPVEHLLTSELEEVSALRDQVQIGLLSPVAEVDSEIEMKGLCSSDEDSTEFNAVTHPSLVTGLQISLQNFDVSEINQKTSASPTNKLSMPAEILPDSQAGTCEQTYDSGAENTIQPQSDIDSSDEESLNPRSSLSNSSIMSPAQVEVVRQPVVPPLNLSDAQMEHQRADSMYDEDADVTQSFRDLSCDVQASESYCEMEGQPELPLLEQSNPYVTELIVHCPPVSLASDGTEALGQSYFFDLAIERMQPHLSSSAEDATRSAAMGICETEQPGEADAFADHISEQGGVQVLNLSPGEVTYIRLRKAEDETDGESAENQYEMMDSETPAVETKIVEVDSSLALNWETDMRHFEDRIISVNSGSVSEQMPTRETEMLIPEEFFSWEAPDKGRRFDSYLKSTTGSNTYVAATSMRVLLFRMLVPALCRKSFHES